MTHSGSSKRPGSEQPSRFYGRVDRRQWLTGTAALGGASVLGVSGCESTEFIDGHQHFWHYSPEHYPWLASDSSLARKFDPSDLQPLLQAARVTGTVLVEARSHVDETERLLAIAEKTSFVRGVVGWLPLQDSSLDSLLERLTHQSALRGLRHAIAAEPDPQFLLRPQFVRGLGRLGAHGLSYDLLVEPANLALVPKLVDQLPNQVFVLDHLAKPPVASGRLEPWRTQLQQLARRGNVYCKLSGLVNEANRQGWKPSDLTPYLDTALEAFSPRRLMFGSDWPMCLLATSYQRWVDTFRRWLTGLSRSEQGRILGATAVEAYRLRKA